MRKTMKTVGPRRQLGWLALVAAAMVLAAGGAWAHPHARNPLRIDVPSKPRMPNTTEPILFGCSGLDDCQAKAKEMCEGFNYPNGKILFRDIAPSPRPFPIYSVICFD